MSVAHFYNQALPDVGDVVMCTVTEYTDAGFKVTLDAYADNEGFIPLCELSQKRIKKNPATFLKIFDKHPVLVLNLASMDSGAHIVVELSLKDVQQDEREDCQKNFTSTVKIYNMCQRLEHITKTSETVWHDAFKQKMSLKTANNFFETLHNEQKIQSGNTGLSKDLDMLLLQHHIQLFGFSTNSIHKTLMIQCFRSDGNNYVKETLSRICPSDKKSDWTTEELNADQERTNVTIKLIGLPKILISVTACRYEKAEQTMADVVRQLHEANFNIIIEV